MSNLGPCRPQASLDSYVCRHFDVKMLDTPGLDGVSASIFILLPILLSLSNSPFPSHFLSIKQDHKGVF